LGLSLLERRVLQQTPSRAQTPRCTFTTCRSMMPVPICSKALAEKYGLDYDTIANHGPSVMEHLTAQTATNGAASVPAGTHVTQGQSSTSIKKDYSSPFWVGCVRPQAGSSAFRVRPANLF